MNVAFGCVVALALCVTVGGCGSKSGTPGGRSRAEPVDLLIHVPADTPYVVHLPTEMLDIARRGLATELVEKLRAQIVDREKDPAQPVGDRVKSELARELAPLDAAAFARVGWDPARGSAVLYGVGLVPVLRVTLDGRAARAALERVARRADLQLESHEAEGVPYVIVSPTKPDGRSIVVAFHPQQVAASATSDPSRIVPHLVSLAPASPSLATSRGDKPRDPGAPASASIFAAVEPARIAAALRAGELVLVKPDLETTPACHTQLAELLEHLPPLTNEFWREGDVVTHSYTAPINALLARVIPAQPALPRWVDAPSPDFQLAAGLPLGPVLALIDDVWTQVQEAREVCGESPAPAAGLATELAALAQVQGGLLAGWLEDDAVHFVGVLDTNDVPAVWTWIGQNVVGQPLPDLPQNELAQAPPMLGLPFWFGHGPGAIIASVGDPERLVALTKEGAAPPVPGTIFRLHIGRELSAKVRAGRTQLFGWNPAAQPGPVYDTAMDTEVSVRDGLVVMRSWGTMRLAAPAN